MADVGRIGPYELKGELGRGAMARVWRAWDPNLEREVAIKEPLFDPSLPEGVLEEMGRRFVAEGRAAARLNHPNVVTIHAADVWDGRPAIVMELVEGATLTALLASGPLEPAQALAVLDQLLDALGYAHGRGVVHRDVKPDNVFVSADGRVKLADFGIAHVDSGATRSTVAGAVLGTPGYMSPEQARGADVDARSDLFSVGVVAYEMLSGRNPFGTGEATTLLYRIVHEPAPELPPSASAGLPADLRPAIMAALAKDPADRPATAGDLKRMLHGEAPINVAQTSTAVRLNVTLENPNPGPNTGVQSIPPSTSHRTPKWLPYAVVGVCCIVVLLIVIVSASAGGGGRIGGVGAGDSGSATMEYPYYVGTSDGYVALYTNSSDTPYEVSDVNISSLGEDSLQKVTNHIGAEDSDEATEIVDQLRSEAQDNESHTSIIGNLINGGHMAMNEQGTLYYASPIDDSDWDTKSLVFCSADGSGKQTFYTAPNDTMNLYHISAIGNDVVFNQVRESESTVVVASLLSGQSITIDSCDKWSLCQVENNWVYYLKDGHVWRSRMDGSSRTSFARLGNDVLWRIWGGRMLSFPERGATALYVSDLNGNNSKTVYSAKGNNTIKNAFPVDDRRVLVWERSSNSGNERIMLVDYAQSSEKELWADSGGIERMCASPNEVIITTSSSGDSYRIFSVKFDGSAGSLNFDVPKRGQTRYTTYLMDRVYFGVVDASAGNQCSIQSVAMSGADYRDR